MTKVSVIIPTYNDWNDLNRCLDALNYQDIGIANFEIIVCNNNASNEVPEFLTKYPNVKIIHVLKPGSYAARNEGVRRSQGKILAFTDSDCVPTPNWLSEGVRLVDEFNCRVAGNVELITPKGKPTLAEAIELVFSFNQKRNAEEGTSVTANLIVSKQKFEEVGVFNESLFSGGDIEWGNRATLKGLPIKYSNEAKVLHPCRATIFDLKKKARRIAGGSANQTLGFKRRFFDLIRGFLPLRIRSMKDSVQLDRKHKVAAFFGAWAFKLYGTFYKLIYLLGLKTAPRS